MRQIEIPQIQAIEQIVEVQCARTLETCANASAFMPAVGSTPIHVDVGPGTTDDIDLEMTSKVQELMRREELHRQLTLAIDDFRKGGAVTTKQHSQLEEVAEEKMRDCW